MNNYSRFQALFDCHLSNDKYFFHNSDRQVTVYTLQEVLRYWETRYETDEHNQWENPGGINFWKVENKEFKLIIKADDEDQRLFFQICSARHILRNLELWERKTFSYY